jgi:gamma-glutamyltranspeptidase/glutathione hydrolase
MAYVLRMKRFKCSALIRRKAMTPTPRNQSYGRGAIVAALAAVLGLSGCGWFGGSKETPGVVGSVRGFLGGVVADEPRAALAARDMLSAGGSAVDAAVAAAFMLTAAYPTQVPLGGGGMCLVSTNAGRVRGVDMLSFPAVAARADSVLATPGLPRGLFTLHARYGTLRWEQVLSPAEIFARSGAPVTRAFANDLAANAGALAADPALRALYAPSGATLSEGTPLVQPDMAVVLGALRQRGPGDLHNGALGRALAQSLQAAGIDFRFEDFAAGLPQFGPAVRVGSKFDFYVAAPPAVGALAAGQIYGALEGRWRSTAAGERAGLVLSTAAAASRERAGFIGPDLAATRPIPEAMGPQRLAALAGAGGAFAAEGDVPVGTGLAVVDRRGMAVACAFSGYKPFGAARLPAGVGMLFAPAPNGADVSARWLTAAIGLRDQKDLVFVGAAGGGASAPLALAQVALDALPGEVELGRALVARRASAPGAPVVGTGDGPARVQAIVCPGGLTDSPEKCRMEADPRGSGLGLGTQ